MKTLVNRSADRFTRGDVHTCIAATGEQKCFYTKSSSKYIVFSKGKPHFWTWTRFISYHSGFDSRAISALGGKRYQVQFGICSSPFRKTPLLDLDKMYTQVQLGICSSPFRKIPLLDLDKV